MIHFLVMLFTFIFSQTTLALDKDKLVIISPHRKSIQNEFIPDFEDYYLKTFGKNIEVEWIDQGGTESDIKFIKAKFEKKNTSADIDIFWGGGDITFLDLEKSNLLEKVILPAKLEQELPKEAVGISLRSNQNKWFASALSSFGIFYNKNLIKLLNLPTPEKWADLAKPEYYGLLSMADPRKSSTSLMMNLIILKSRSWDEAWKVFFAMAGNAPKFTHSSSDPIKATVSGDAAVATAIDFYASAKILNLGSQNLGFTLPQGETVYNSDPIALLKGAPHSLQGKRFIEYVLSSTAQKKLILPKGHLKGPKLSDLSRMAINKKAYEDLDKEVLTLIQNPFQTKGLSLKISFEELSNVKKVISDAIGVLHVDLHKELIQTWSKLIKKGLQEKDWQNLAAPPFTEKELENLALKWDDNTFRNQTMNEWIKKSREKYQSYLTMAQSS
jgi:iron(III) transport system substrate-binding protein